jgi:hypothetical protein
VQTCISPLKHSPYSSTSTQTGPFPPHLPPGRHASKGSATMHATTFCSFASPVVQRRDQSTTVSVELSLRLPTAVRYAGCRRQCREPTIASAVRSAGLASVFPALHCIAERPPPGPQFYRLCRRTWLTLRTKGVYIEIDLHCICTVSRTPSPALFPNLLACCSESASAN